MTDNNAAQATPLDPPVLAAVDGSAISYQTAAWAAVDAGLRGCPLHIVTSVYVPVGFGPGVILTDDDVELLMRDGQRVVDEASRVARAAAAGAAVEITTEVTREPIAEHLIARSRQARALVLGSRGLGAIRRGLLGSVVAALTRHAHCPVAVIPTTAATDPLSAEKPVLVGVDGSPNSVPALEFAFAEASLRKVGVTAVHAWSDVLGSYVPLIGWEPVRAQEDELLAERLAGFGERYPDVPVRRILVMDRPVRSLLEETGNAQLLVVGSHGRGGFAGMLLGSTSAALLHDTDIPTVVVRGPRSHGAE